MLAASNHPAYDQLSPVQQEVATLLVHAAGEVLPFPPGLGRAPTVIVAAEARIWPEARILLVAEEVSRPTWRRYWEEFGAGVLPFLEGRLPAPGQSAVSAVTAQELTHNQDELFAAGWDLALVSCAQPLANPLMGDRPRALGRLRASVTTWTLINQQDLNPSLDLSAIGVLLAGLEAHDMPDHLTPIARPGVRSRPSAMAERGGMMGLKSAIIAL